MINSVIILDADGYVNEKITSYLSLEKILERFIWNYSFFDTKSNSKFGFRKCLAAEDISEGLLDLSQFSEEQAKFLLINWSGVIDRAGILKGTLIYFDVLPISY